MGVNSYEMGSTIRTLLFPCFVLSLLMLQTVKGEAKAGHMYVYGNVVDSCVTIEKSRQTLSRCPVDHPVPALFAQHYENGHTLLNATLEMLDSNMAQLSQQCRDDVKSIFCRQITPRCLQNGTEVDFGNMQPLCDKVKASCPKDVGEEDEGFCDSVVSGKFKQLSECVAPSKPIEGICPQPKYKMPAFHLENYKKISEKYAEMFASFPPNVPIFPKDCIQQMKDILCMQVACSKDEQQLLVKKDQGDCQATISNCFKTLDSLPMMKKVLTSLKNLLHGYCLFYPSANETQIKADLSEIRAEVPTVQTKAGVHTIVNLREHTTKSPTSSANSHVVHTLLYIFLLFKLFP